MKQSFHKIGSMVMAFLVLCSTMSFTVDKHFCGKVLVDQAVFSEAKSCGMHPAKTTEAAVDTCCDEKKISVEGQKELKISFEDLEIPQQVFLSSFAYSFLALYRVAPEKEEFFLDYSPPLLVYDIQVLDQTFLI